MIANEILDRCSDKLETNTLDSDSCELAQSICFLERNNPECREAIERFTTLADKLTDGIFSLTIKKWIKTKSN